MTLFQNVTLQPFSYTNSYSNSSFCRASVSALQSTSLAPSSLAPASRKLMASMSLFILTVFRRSGRRRCVRRRTFGASARVWNARGDALSEHGYRRCPARRDPRNLSRAQRLRVANDTTV